MYELLMKRRSVRYFKDQAISEEIIDKLLDAANNSPTVRNIQPISIILIQTIENRNKLAELVGDQPWVNNTPLSMVFCLDFNRVKRRALLNGIEFKGEKVFAQFLFKLRYPADRMVVLNKGSIESFKNASFDFSVEQP
jgi:nitroreductase